MTAAFVDDILSLVCLTMLMKLAEGTLTLTLTLITLNNPNPPCATHCVSSHSLYSAGTASV